jgi:hypothetical protein
VTARSSPRLFWTCGLQRNSVPAARTHAQPILGRARTVLRIGHVPRWHAGFIRLGEHDRIPREQLEPARRVRALPLEHGRDDAIVSHAGVKPRERLLEIRFARRDATRTKTLPCTRTPLESEPWFRQPFTRFENARDFFADLGSGEYCLFSDRKVPGTCDSAYGGHALTLRTLTIALGQAFDIGR